MTRRIDPTQALLVVIDMQEKLLPHIHDHGPVEQNIIRLTRGTHTLGVPMLLTEQYPQGIGPTIPPILEAVSETHGKEAIQKMTFSACGARSFLDEISRTGRRDIILCGIETHVCVHQTALDLLDRDLRVWLVADAVSSRTARNRDIAIDRLAREGAKITSTEMILFELTVECGTDRFRAISKLVK